MNKVKAVVIENDVLIRRVFYNILNTFEAVETQVLCDYDELSSVLKQEHYDVAFLNVEEPVFSKEKVFEKIIGSHPKMAVIATAKRTEKGASTVIKALKYGAVDFITKPARYNSVLMASHHFEKRIAHVIENIIRSKAEIVDKKLVSFPKRKLSRQRAKMVIMGSGSEGIKTMHTIFKKLPENLAAPIVVVSHFPKIFTRELADWLNLDSQMEVREAFDGVALNPGSAWIIPGGFHGEVVRADSEYLLRVHRGARENGVRPSIDVSFRSVSRLFGDAALGVILSGYGYDGFSGAQLMKENGGQLIIQKPDGLFAAKLLHDILKAGLSDQICSEEYLCWEIMKRTRLSKTSPKKIPIPETNFVKSNRNI